MAGSISEPAGDPAAIYEWSLALDEVANSIAELAFDTASTTAQIRERADWTGGAADAYTSYCDSVATPLGRIPTPLHQAAAAVRSYAETLFTAKAQVRNANADASTAVGSAASAQMALQATSIRADAAAAEGAVTAADSLHDSDSAIKTFWDATEPARKILEALLAPLDIIAADHWIDIAKELAGLPREWVGELDETLEAAEKLMQEGGPIVEKLIEAAEEAERVGGKIDALLAFGPRWLEGAAGWISEISWASVALTGLGVLADIGTIISPQDSGLLGWFDRGVAGFNGALLTLNACLDDIPIVGEVVIIGSGVYLAGDFLYHHWTPFRNVCNSVGHVFMSGVAWTTEHGLASAGSWVEHTAGGIASTVESWL